MKYMILVIGVVYLCIGIDQYLKGQPWQLGLYAGYAFANVALFMMAK
jgi:hypothetical protein